MKKIVLASSSPRRKQLLENIGLKFQIVPSNFEEKVDKNLDSHSLAKYLSKGKAQDVAKRYKNAVIIACDTFIIVDNELIGKPKSKKDAKKILKKISGRCHFVISGITIIDSGTDKLVSKSIETKVFVKNLTDKEIDGYIATGEPMDKAGAYGIHALGSTLIEKIDGDYFNVVGLPICLLVETLKEFDVHIF